MKKTIIMFVVFFWLFNFQVSAQTFEFELDDETDLYQQMYDDYVGEDLYYSLPDEAKNLVDEFELTPSDPFSFNRLFSADGFEYFKNFFSEKLAFPLKSMSVILISVIVCALCHSITGNSLQVNQSMNFMCALSIVTAVIIPLNSLVIEAVELVDTINIFMGIFIPVFAGILIASLKSGTATAYSSVMFFVCEGISYCCNYLFLPLINCFSALSIATGFSNSFKLSGITNFIKKTVYIALSAVMAVFLAVLSAQSFVSSAADNVSSKTAKFIISSFVPIIGPSISESLGSLKSCIGLLRTSVGIYAVIAVVVMILPVLIKLIVFKLSLIICSSSAEIFSLETIKNMLDSINQALSVVLAVVLCIGIMFVFAITIVSMAGGLS